MKLKIQYKNIFTIIYLRNLNYIIDNIYVLQLNKEKQRFIITFLDWRVICDFKKKQTLFNKSII